MVRVGGKFQGGSLDSTIGGVLTPDQPQAAVPALKVICGVPSVVVLMIK